MDEILEHIARAIHANDYVRGLCDLGWGESHVNREAYRANARAVVEALGIDVRHWVQHDGTRKRYYAITWTGADQ